MRAANAGKRGAFLRDRPNQVVSIAKSKQFTYLTTCLSKYDIVLGDARLTMAEEQDESFDLLVVDAFSSDAIPMHLDNGGRRSRCHAQKLKTTGAGVLHINRTVISTSRPSWRRPYQGSRACMRS